MIGNAQAMSNPTLMGPSGLFRDVDDKANFQRAMGTPGGFGEYEPIFDESGKVLYCRFCDRKPSQLVQLFDELSKSGIMLPPTSYQEWLNQKGDRQ